MWGRDSRKKLLLNAFLVILIAAVLGGLVFFMLKLRAQTEEHDKELAEMQVQQVQQQAEARTESLTAIDNEYARQMKVVADYMPGIVCWGDNTTAASSGILNYPYVLQTYINTYICDIYDFSSTIDNARDFARLDWKKYKVSIPVVNLGTGRESSHTIIGRATGYVLSSDALIGNEPVTVYFTSPTGETVTPLTGGDVSFNNVTIGDIEGKLVLDTTNYNYDGSANYVFTRITQGPEVTVPAGTPVIPASAGMYKDYIHVVMLGMYGEYDDGADLVEQVKTLLARQKSDRYIILGPYSHDIFSSNSSMDNVDSAMLQAFGSKYISVRKYLLGDGYAAAGMSATKEDTYYIDQGLVPPSFRVASHNEELNSVAHKLIGKLVYNRMDNLGYFDEVKKELGITEVTKKILQNDPEYFETIVGNILK